jgi:hypothetical protein
LDDSRTTGEETNGVLGDIDGEQARSLREEKGISHRHSSRKPRASLRRCFADIGTRQKLFEEVGRGSLDGDHLCHECDGTGWVLYRSETVDGEFEEAYRLCPEGHAPRYCMGSSSDHLCTRPATVRCGIGYYCKEHSAVILDGRDVDGTCGTI